LQDIKKELRFAGKGHNEILEIVNAMMHARTASDPVDVHVPENGGTCKNGSQVLMTRRIRWDNEWTKV
jgi:hypothetical protein